MLAPITYLNTRLKLFEKVSLLLLIMVVVAGVNIAVIYSYHQQAEQVGNSVNIAGQQRMLSQRMVRLANEIDHGEDTQLERNRLRVAIERYDRNLEALTDGGTVTDSELNPGADAVSGLPSVTLRGERLAPAPPPTREELAQERGVWSDYKPHITTVLNADPESPEFQTSIAYVRTNSDQLLSVSDAVTAEFARVIRDRRSQLEEVLVILLVVDLGVAVVGGLFARHFIGLPMVAIARTGKRLAAGDTETETEESIPIDRSLPEHLQRAELAQLSRSFEAVRDYHRTVSGQAQALAKRDFEAPVLDETVPGELGRSLDTMRGDLKAYIDELQTTTEKLDAVIQASPAAILITDTKGRVQRWNPAAEEIFGWAADDVLGEPNPAVPEEAFEAYRERLSEVIVGESVTGIEGKRRTRSGEVIDVSVSLATVAGADGELEGVMAVVEDITERKERERTLRQQRDELEMLNRITDLVLAITQELVESSSRERIEDSVTASLAESDLYETAWIGEPQAGRPEILVRSASLDGETPGTLTLEPTDAVGEAIQTTIDTGEMQVIQADGASKLVAPGDGAEFAGTAPTVAVVPLSYRGTVYGVLVVSTDREYSYQDRERSGLRTLGKTVGFAINAITNKKLLFADTVVDLTFDVGGTDLPLVRTTADLGCTVALDGFVVATATDALNIYLEVDGIDGETFVEAVVEEPGVLDARVIADEPGHRRVEVTMAENSLLRRFSHHEARLRAVDIDDGEGTYVLEAPLAADIEAIVELMNGADDRVEFLAKAERERRVTTAAETATAVEDRLTDRQYEVFKTAYFGGYFEWPRDSTIEDLAENMGIAGSTFHHHLRHAQRKLARVLFGRDHTTIQSN